MICVRCGRTVDGGAKRCPHCGAKLPRGGKKGRGGKIGCGLLVILALFIIIGVASELSSGGSGGVPIFTAAPSPEETSNQEALYEEFMHGAAALISEYGVGEGEGEFSCRRLLVSGAEHMDPAAYGAVAAVQSPDGLWVLQFETPEATQAAFEQLEAESLMYRIEPDRPVFADWAPDTDYISWGSSAIAADLFTELLSQMDYESVTVAVADTGVAEHQLLELRLRRGWNFVDDNDDTGDIYGHGTHVAGIVADVTRGIMVDILPVKVLGDSGRGSMLGISLGVRYAADQGADVLNLSLSGSHFEYLDECIEYALSKGVIVVAAAGNYSQDVGERCPAHIPGCITVSALDGALEFADFSNYGDAVDFCAPGVDVNSSVPGGYMYKSGTSMAAPHVSGVAALLKAAGLASSATEVQSILANCAVDLGATGWDKFYGYGMPRLEALVEPEPVFSPGLETPPESETPPPETETPPPEAADPLFDGTYWNIGLGQTMGGQYQAKFSADGSFMALSAGSGYATPGSYTYEDGILTLTFAWIENVPFVSDGNNGFVSVEEYEMQVGYDHYSMSPSDGSYFIENYDPSKVD